MLSNKLGKTNKYLCWHNYNDKILAHWGRFSFDTDDCLALTAAE